VVDVKHLRTYYFLRQGIVKAVDDVSFRVNENEMLGLAGESGCGKSTIALSLLRLIPHPGRIVDGDILLEGESIIQKAEDEMRKIRWKKIAMCFQDSMNALNPVLKIGEQIAETFTFHEHMSRHIAWEKSEGLLKMVGVNPDRAGNYPHEFSGGMRQRAMIAMALALNPRLIILDEPTTALDVIVQAQVLDWIRDVQRKMRHATILVSHDLSTIARTCDRVAILYAGKIVEEADVKSLFREPLHPYSQGLMKSFPSIRGPRKRLISVVGFPADLLNPPPGCRFHPRCTHCNDVCREEEPSMVETKPGHNVACHFAG
jgi:oligopeptide/dipeptide ABC transporter ATP-binding protein